MSPQHIWFFIIVHRLFRVSEAIYIVSCRQGMQGCKSSVTIANATLSVTFQPVLWKYWD